MSRVSASFERGAEYAGVGVEAATKLEKLRNDVLKRDIESAAGYTAADMQAELGIDLSAVVLATPDVQRTATGMSAQERAIAREEAAKSLQAVVDDAAPVPLPQPVVDKVQQMLKLAVSDAEARRLEEERRKLERARKKKAEGDADGAEDGGGDAEGGDEGDITQLPVYKLIAPQIVNADEFASFVYVWATERLRKDRPDLDPATMYRHPAALRDLQRTAQNLLNQLATDLLGTGKARVQVVRDIAGMTDAKTVRSTLRDIAYIYGRLHADALRTTRKEMIDKLEREIKRLAVEPGRYRAQREDLKRRVTAKVETFARTVVSYLRLNAMEMEAESKRLRTIIERGDAEESHTGYTAKDDVEFRKALDQYAVLTEYGGMITWMPGQISDKAAELVAQLSGKRAEWEARREQVREKAHQMAGLLAQAVSRDDANLQPEPGLGNRFVDSLIGNLQLRLTHAVRFAKGQVRADALKAVEDIMVILGDGATDYRMYEMDGHAAINQALADAYGTAKAGLTHLDENITPEAQQLLSRQGVQLTYGRALQLYGSIIQKDYVDNVRRHGRAKDLAVLRSILSAQDLAFHHSLVGWYRENRQMLSVAQERITGNAMLSPDQFYLPVKMYLDPGGFNGRHAAWTPIAKALSPRIKNKKDFDESASILDMFADRLQGNALVVAYGERGLFLRDVIGSTGFQSALERFHGTKARAALVNHFEDTLRGGKQVTRTDGIAIPTNITRRWMARFFLSGNVASAIKQVASVPVWANVVGFRAFARYLVDIDRGAIAELMESREFHARYKGGWSEETNNILSDQNRSLIAKAYDKGMILNSAMDAAAGLWIAQGLYRDLKAKFADQGYSPADAKSRAQTIVWNLVEQTQQSARTENLTLLSREGGPLARAVLQFCNSPLQQLQYEVQAAREAMDGAEGAKARLARALVINHVLVPGLLYAVGAGLKAVLGVPPKDDDERRMWTELIIAAILGQASALFLVGSMGEAGLRGLLGDKMPYGSGGALPVEASAMIVWRAATVAGRGAGLAVNLITAQDLADVTTADLLTDVQKFGEQAIAPYRHVSTAIRNRQE